ncbi:MAG: hypothetical protein ACXVLT_13475, partial [Flavisolibacter sp.]
ETLRSQDNGRFSPGVGRADSIDRPGELYKEDKVYKEIRKFPMPIGSFQPRTQRTNWSLNPPNQPRAERPSILFIFKNKI